MTKFEVHPYTTSRSDLREQRQIYARHKTPVRDRRGRLQELDMAPADASTAGGHLEEVHRRFGDRGLAQSVRGLSVTRGWAFADQAIRRSPDHIRKNSAASLVGANVGEEPLGEVVGGRAGSTVKEAVTRSGPGRPLPENVRDRLGGNNERDFSKVRVHNDEAAQQAARMMGARAFTIGDSIYFGEAEYNPSTSEGFRLLAHEAGHTIQSDGPTGPVDQMEVSDPSSSTEREADRFAADVDNPEVGAAHLGRSSPGRILRRISFTRDNDRFLTNDPATAETAATFQIAQGAGGAPHFRWDADVTIHGNPGDPFANFQVGPLQIVRAFWLNIWWGTGANRTHRTSSVAIPIRDATAAGNTWYDDPLASANFGANGDVRSTNLNDTPGVTGQPFANPVGGRASTRGWFNWGMAFVAYIAARDTTRAGAAAFRTVGSVYWNLSLEGNFDVTRPVGGRVQVTGGGRTNRGGVIDGPPAEFSPIHGGPIFNNEANANLTTT